MTDPATTATSPKADIGVTGLAVMGSNLARNFARNGFVTAVHNRTTAKTKALIEEHGGDGTFVPSDSTQEFVASLAVPRKILIMVKAGGPTDAVIDELAALVEPGDIIIDGGNAKFADTRRRQAALQEKGIHFVGCGVSGGEEGALNGPSIMPGGSAKSYESLGPILERISAHVDGAPCCTHIGTDGAGHFVKMVHNGIEYADMQLIAEAYDLLRRGAELSPSEIGDIFAEWNKGDLDSFLVEITAEVLRHVDPETGAAIHRCRGRRRRNEGHRHLDRPDRPRPRNPGVRHRRSRLRPRALLRRGPACGRCRQAARTERQLGGEGSGPSSSRTSGSRCTPRRSSPTRRVWTRSSPAPPNTAGTSMSVRWRGSGAAAASSGPSS